MAEPGPAAGPAPVAKTQWLHLSLSDVAELLKNCHGRHIKTVPPRLTKRKPLIDAAVYYGHLKYNTCISSTSPRCDYYHCDKYAYDAGFRMITLQRRMPTQAYVRKRIFAPSSGFQQFAGTICSIFLISCWASMLFSASLLSSAASHNSCSLAFSWAVCARPCKIINCYNIVNLSRLTTHDSIGVVIWRLCRTIESQIMNLVRKSHLTLRAVAHAFSISRTLLM